MNTTNIIIRQAERKDARLILEFIKGIARYEKMENEVVASPEVLEREMFDERLDSLPTGCYGFGKTKIIMNRRMSFISRNLRA